MPTKLRIATAVIRSTYCSTDQPHSTVSWSHGPARLFLRPFRQKPAFLCQTRNDIAAPVTQTCHTFIPSRRCLSVFGANDSRALLPFKYKALIVPLILRHIIANHEKQETYVTNSTLDWTLVRPGNFTKGGFTGSYRHGFTPSDAPSKIKISQPDLAGFMLKQLDSDTYLRKAPCISY